MFNLDAFRPASSALMRFHGFGGGRGGGAEVILLIVGVGFAGLLVWAIQRSGKSTT